MISKVLKSCHKLLDILPNCKDLNLVQDSSKLRTPWVDYSNEWNKFHLCQSRDNKNICHFRVSLLTLTDKIKFYAKL